MGNALSLGQANGELLMLTDTLSFWGGFNLATGSISDNQHPQKGAVLSNKVIGLSSGRGSSSASSVLTEAIRSGVAPSAILMLEPDPIIVLGTIVAAELYQKTCPVIGIKKEDWQSLTDFERASCSASELGKVTLYVS